VYLLDADEKRLNRDYVQALALDETDGAAVLVLLREHHAQTGSPRAEALLADFDPGRYCRVVTRLRPEALE
jgi:glutamate synthase (NADPH/NADH) large chain